MMASDYMGDIRNRDIDLGGEKEDEADAMDDEEEEENDAMASCIRVYEVKAQLEEILTKTSSAHFHIFVQRNETKKIVFGPVQPDGVFITLIPNHESMDSGLLQMSGLTVDETRDMLDPKETKLFVPITDNTLSVENWQKFFYPKDCELHEIKWLCWKIPLTSAQVKLDEEFPGFTLKN